MGKYVCVLIIDISTQSQAQIHLHTSGGRVIAEGGKFSSINLANVFTRLDLQKKLEQDQPLLLLWVNLSFKNAF